MAANPPSDYVKHDVLQRLTSSTVVKACVQHLPALGAEQWYNNLCACEASYRNSPIWKMARPHLTAQDVTTTIGNITGPDPSLPQHVMDVDNADIYGAGEANNRACSDLLVVNGEAPYEYAKYIPYLTYARHIIVDSHDTISTVFDKETCFVLKWWALRVQLLHFKTLNDDTDTLRESICLTCDYLSENNQLKGAEAAAVLLEVSIACATIKDNERFKKATTAGQSSMSLDMEMTGIMGKRTRWQSDDLAQLVLLATESNSDKQPTNKQVDGPAHIAIDDDVLLPDANIALTSAPASATSHLSPLAQCYILSKCIYVHNTNPMHGLTSEEMMPYVSRVLAECNNWMVHSMALLTRARLHIKGVRTAETAVLQIQALIDQIPLIDDAGLPYKRMDCVFMTLYPMIWNLKREVGQAYMTLGVYKSAFEEFMRLQMHDDAVKCLHIIGEKQQARELLVELLTKESINLALPIVEPVVVPKRGQSYLQRIANQLCMLGDVMNERIYYDLALKYCNSSRAYRSLGLIEMEQNKDLAKAVEYFKLAVEINPLITWVWYRMGVSAMQLSDWNTAQTAFNRVTSQSMDDGEAWANLATVLLKRGNLMSASNALSEALRHSRDNWKIWDNYLNVSMGIGDYTHAIMSMKHLATLNPRNIDTKALTLITESVIRNVQDCAGNGTDRLRPALLDLLAALGSSASNEPEVWSNRAKLEDNLETRMEYYIKAVRCAALGPYDSDLSVFTSVVAHIERWCDCVLQCSDAKAVYSAVLYMKSFNKKSDRHNGTSEHNLCVGMLESLQAHEKSLRTSTA